jgi:hypothetical protein
MKKQKGVYTFAVLLTAGLGFSSIKVDSNVSADESKYEVTYKSDEGYLFGKSDKKGVHRRGGF